MNNNINNTTSLGAAVDLPIPDNMDRNDTIYKFSTGHDLSAQIPD